MESAFKKQVHGGSAVILQHLTNALEKSGDTATVLCRYRSNNSLLFKMGRSTTVKPILKFKEVFPDAYFTPPYNISTAVSEIKNHLSAHDIFINFDSNFIFQDIIESQIPIINCLHDFVYSGALQGTFLFRRDIIVTNSYYVREVVLNTMGRFFRNLDKKIVVINNGIDTFHFKKTKPQRILEYLPTRIIGRKLLLCPHRPEYGKGIFESLEVLDRLVSKYRHTDYILLIPLGLDKQVSSDVQDFYKELKLFIKKRKLTKFVIFHDWIPHNLMPEYLSLGKVTLCIGNQIESFGNIPLESISCGTPSIVSRVGAYRNIMPDWGIIKTDYSDINDVVDKILDLEKNKPMLKRSIDYINENYSLVKMTSQYVDLIHGLKAGPSLRYSPEKITNYFTIPPWCYISKKGIYNDYEKSYRKDTKLERLLSLKPLFTYKDASSMGLNKNWINEELKKGYIINYKRAYEQRAK